MKSAENIRLRLHELSNLQECVLKDIIFYNWGTSLKLLFDYIWNSDAHDSRITAESVSNPMTVTLVSSWVFGALFDNAPTDSMLELSPENISWGIGEIAHVEIANDYWNRDDNDPIPCTRLDVFWEGPRKISVWCAEIAVEGPK